MLYGAEKEIGGKGSSLKLVLVAVQKLQCDADFFPIVSSCVVKDAHFCIKACQCQMALNASNSGPCRQH